jgi:hypothetical protein
MLELDSFSPDEPDRSNGGGEPINGVVLDFRWKADFCTTKEKSAKLAMISARSAELLDKGYPRGDITEAMVNIAIGTIDQAAVERTVATAFESKKTLKSILVAADERVKSTSRVSWRDELMSAAALQEMEFPPLRWLIEPYIPQGLIIFAGRPKLGKGVFWLQQAVSIAEAGGDVLYLALEDGKRRINARLKKMNKKAPERLKFTHKWRRANEGGLADIKEWCSEVSNPTAVIVDTLEGFRPTAKGKQRDYSADYDATKDCLQIVNSFPVSIVFIHHDRKAEAEDPFDTVSGTLGLTAPLDTICVMKKQNGNVVLYVRGRDVEESETALKFDKDACRWSFLGDAADVNRSDQRQRILIALNEEFPDDMSVGEIVRDLGAKSRSTVERMLSRMKKAGEIKRTGRGRYTLPDRTN